MSESHGQKFRSNGFQVGGSCGDLFESTAQYYAKYRRPYPETVVKHLVGEFGLNGEGRLLDVGCGTGQVFQVLAKHFEEVIAIDPNTEMIDYAKQAAAGHGPGRVMVKQMRGEDIDARLGNFRMVTFGASFHWTDRQLVGELVYDRLVAGGSLVVLAPTDFQSGTTEWEAEIRALLAKWIGSERRAGQGVYQSGERHAEAIKKTRFRVANTTNITVLEDWSIEQIVGYLLSTSYASKAVLGSKTRDFIHAVRERLLSLRSDGHFARPEDYSVISATRLE